MTILAIIGTVLLTFGVTAATIDDLIRSGEW